jgi:hypothetical protein
MAVRTGIGQNEDDPDDDFALEIFMSTPNPSHRWHYVDNFHSQEMLMFKTYDSDMHPFVPTMHSAFDLHDQEAAPARESCEARIVCLLRRPYEQEAADAEEEGEVSPDASAKPADPLRVVRESAQFAEIKAALRAEPGSASQVVMGLMETAPELAAAIMNNRVAFKALLMEDDRGGGAKL